MIEIEKLHAENVRLRSQCGSPTLLDELLSPSGSPHPADVLSPAPPLSTGRFFPGSSTGENDGEGDDGFGLDLPPNDPFETSFDGSANLAVSLHMLTNTQRVTHSCASSPIQGDLSHSRGGEHVDDADTTAIAERRRRLVLDSTIEDDPVGVAERDANVKGAHLQAMSQRQPSGFIMHVVDEELGGVPLASTPLDPRSGNTTFELNVSTTTMTVEVGGVDESVHMEPPSECASPVPAHYETARALPPPTALPGPGKRAGGERPQGSLATPALTAEAIIAAAVAEKKKKSLAQGGAGHLRQVSDDFVFPAMYGGSS